MTNKEIEKLFKCDISSLSNSRIDELIIGISDEQLKSELSIDSLDLLDGIYFNLLFEKKERSCK